jgi:hypothetical protein
MRRSTGSGEGVPVTSSAEFATFSHGALGGRGDLGSRSRLGPFSQAVVALPHYTDETNSVLVRDAQRWIAEVLADRDSTSQRLVSD